MRAAEGCLLVTLVFVRRFCFTKNRCKDLTVVLEVAAAKLRVDPFDRR